MMKQQNSLPSSACSTSRETLVKSDHFMESTGTIKLMLPQQTCALVARKAICSVIHFKRLKLVKFTQKTVTVSPTTLVSSTIG